MSDISLWSATVHIWPLVTFDQQFDSSGQRLPGAIIVQVEVEGDLDELGDLGDLGGLDDLQGSPLEQNQQKGDDQQEQSGQGRPLKTITLWITPR